jgi:hypothetical protein
MWKIYTCPTCAKDFFENKIFRQKWALFTTFHVELVGRILPIFIYFKEEIKFFFFLNFNYASVIKNERRRKRKKQMKEKKPKKKEKKKKKRKPCNINLLYIKHMILAIARLIRQTFLRTNDAPRYAALAYDANLKR